MMYNFKEIVYFMANISDKTAEWLRDKGYDGGYNATEVLVWLYKKGAFNPCVSTVGESCIYGYRMIDSRPFYYVKIKDNDLEAASCELLEMLVDDKVVNMSFEHPIED